jgi:hypothetical protein
VVGPVIGATAIVSIAEVTLTVLAIVVDTVAVPVMADLMFTLAVIHRVIAAVTCLRDSGHRDHTACQQRRQRSCVA